MTTMFIGAGSDCVLASTKYLLETGLWGGTVESSKPWKHLTGASLFAIV
jgi:hypothetical protein